MNFRTELKIPPSEAKIEHSNKILTIGSCFAENIAEQFKFYLFNVFENPFGVLYNPASVYNAFKIIDDKRIFTEKDLVYNQNEWHSFYHHSDFSHYETGECLNRINTRSEEVRDYLAECNWVIISIGTSYIYRHIEKNIIVSNCHKIPANNFERILLPVDETEKYLKNTIGLLKSFNPGIKVILTVSPVRHIKDGFAENQLSKSALIVAVHRIVESGKDCFYFPSYEVMMDDLRDYRFYERDLLHPNKTGVEYIWEKFSEWCFSEECKAAVKEIEPYARGMQHRPISENSPNFKSFKENLQKTGEILINKYPYLKETK